MELDELKNRLKECGIVGAGGAGFPSYGKLAEGADILLVNGSECEPLLYTDFFLLKRELDTVLSGICELLKASGIPRALLCVKDRVAKLLKLKDGEKLAAGVALKALPDVYPMGDEISLIYQATGRVVKPGNLPITAGVIVYNVETVYNIAKAVVSDEKVTTKWVMIGGAIPEPIVVKVPIGAPVSSLFEKFSITIPEGYAVLDGGPSMGKIIDPDRAVVTKTTKGLLVLPEDTEAVQSKRMDAEMSIARAETACCQCTRCTDMCPRALLGYPLEPHKMVRTAKQAVEISPEMALTASLCCQCGVCASFACCQGISPKAVIEHYKTILAKNRLRYTSKVTPQVAEEREWRMIPEERWAQVLGVAKYDKIPTFRGEVSGFDRVEIPMRGHIGAPSVPVVSVGAIVDFGEKIAESAEGLSLPQFASVSGKVVFVTEDKIIIDRLN